MDLAGSVLALPPACDLTHPFRFREEWVSRFLASAPCVLFACSEAYPLDQAGAAELAPVEVLTR